MKKLLSLLLVATIITSTLCVSYFAFDNVDNLSNITTSEPTEKGIETSTISTSDEATTEPSSTDENTTETSTEPSSSISTPDELTRLVTSIKLNRSKVTIDKGRSIRLVATVTPNDADNKALIWKSNNTNIATVNNGYVKAIKTGKATIIVSSSDGSNITAKCDITVVQKATKVTVRQYYHINKPSKKLYKLNSKVYPSDTTDKSLIYRSSNNKVATINRNGQIKAKKYGKATITVINKKSRKSAKCLLIVGQYVSKIKLSKNKVTLNNGKATKLKSKVTNKKAIYKAIQWKSTNTNIAKVNSNGVVKALKRGTCYVIAVAKDGSRKSAKCKVTVRQLVTKLSYNKKTQKAEVYKNKTIKFAVTVAPSNANNKGLTYSSSNKKVATVNSKGIIKGIKAGTVTITAKAKDGSRKAVKLTVKVKNPPVTMHTKMTREQFVSNKKYVDMYCKALNDYFESCGAYIDYNMKYVDEGQWCVISSDMFDDGDSIYDFMVGTVGLWTWRIAYDRLSSDKDPDLVETCQSWKNFRSLNKEAEDFLDEVNRVSSPNLKTYNPKKMLDKDWNGWKWFCDMWKADSVIERPLSVYVKAEPIKAYDSSIQKVTTVYRIKMYWG